jgi:hypothetical protein
VSSAENCELSPQLLKPLRIRSGVAHNVLNVAVPKVVLDQPGVRALIDESKAAGMPQHVGMNGHRQPSLFPVLA